MNTRTAEARRALSLVLAVAIVLGGIAVATAPAGADDPAPVTGTQSGQTIPDEYIVVLKPGRGADDRRSAEAEARAQGGQVHYEYTAALNGFAAHLPPQALQGLQRNPHVAYIEADQIVTATGDQSGPPWGLDRIDQRNLPLNSGYHYDTTGAGVTAYIIDTGMRLTHSQYAGRATSGYDAIDGGSADDCSGHGTHVAGTVGGSTYGVAKGVSLVAVRVLNCQGSGSTSGVIAGVNWVTSNHQAGAPAVANMSLSGGASSSLDTAVSNSVADGITYAVAAGNDNGANACTRSPARAAAAVTVGATTSSDSRASYSNTGTCLDLFAPGSGVQSSWYTSDSATNTLSGTSMASPHAAGAAALYLQSNPTATAQQVRDQLVNTATTGVVGSAGSGSPNRLLYTLGSSGSPTTTAPTTTAPTTTAPTTTAPTTTAPTTTAPTTTTPTTTTPPTGCAVETYTGSLSGTGDYDAQPNGSYWQAAAGTHYGCLTGPSGADFDLALYRWNGYGWSRVAVSDGSTSTESITYNGSAGYYYWRVYSYSGSGSYTLRVKRP